MICKYLGQNLWTHVAAVTVFHKVDIHPATEGDVKPYSLTHSQLRSTDITWLRFRCFYQLTNIALPTVIIITIPNLIQHVNLTYLALRDSLQSLS